MNTNDINFVPDKVKLIAQIPIDSNPNKEPVQRTYQQSNSTDYLLGYAAVALVATVGYWGLWLKKYFETRLEMSIERQKQEFSDAREDRDRAQSQLVEDRKRSQLQADLFLTATLETIKEEKENNLNALNRVTAILEKFNVNLAEMLHQILEFKGESAGTAIRIQNIQNSIANIQSATQVCDGGEHR